MTGYAAINRPDGRPLPESYPWLRLRLESCDVLIKHTLTLDVED